MDTQKPEQKQNEQAQQVQATEQAKPATSAEQPVREKTQEELDYEAGYYACCFRSH